MIKSVKIEWVYNNKKADELIICFLFNLPKASDSPLQSPHIAD